MSRKSGFRKFLGFVGSVIAANAAGMALACKVQEDKMKEHEGQNNLMHSVTLGKQTVSMKADTNNAYITCMTGFLELTMPEIPTNKDVYINLVSVFGKVVINLPLGVQTVFEGEGHLESLKSVMPDYEEDAEAPTVHIIRKTVASLVEVHAHTTRQE